MPYTGAGSGLTRAQLYTPNIKFENDERLKEFVVTIWRNPAAEISDVYDRVPYRMLELIQKNIIQYCLELTIPDKPNSPKQKYRKK